MVGAVVRQPKMLPSHPLEREKIAAQVDICISPRRLRRLLAPGEDDKGKIIPLATSGEVGQVRPDDAGRLVMRSQSFGHEDGRDAHAVTDLALSRASATCASVQSGSWHDRRNRQGDRSLSPIFVVVVCAADAPSVFSYQAPGDWRGSRRPRSQQKESEGKQSADQTNKQRAARLPQRQNSAGAGGCSGLLVYSPQGHPHQAGGLCGSRAGVPGHGVSFLSSRVVDLDPKHIRLVRENSIRDLLGRPHTAAERASRAKVPLSQLAVFTIEVSGKRMLLDTEGLTLQQREELLQVLGVISRQDVSRRATRGVEQESRRGAGV